MELVHTVYAPAGDGPHPTLLALHGWGANALDLLGLAPHLAGGELLVLCPQGPVTVPIGPGMQGAGWFPLTMGAPPDPVAFAAAVTKLERVCAEAERTYPIARDRFAVLGFSQGGVMAYALATRQPERFAAIAALSTWFAPGLIDTSQPPDLAGRPVLVQHGTRDELISVERGRESVELLRRCRADVTWREYDMGHEISAASLRDLAAYLQRHLFSPIIRP